MPPKKKSTPAPIDRPLSKAYLRAFSGWSNEWAPGVSDPTSLRVMENVYVDRDGSVRVRPGLRARLRAEDGSAANNEYGDIVGTHEVFYRPNGEKAYLYAFRALLGQGVAFAAMVEHADGYLTPVSLASIGVTPYGPLAFSDATTYVKFLQIDNRIIALSNAGEEARYFEVSDVQFGKRLYTVDRPAWTVADKLTFKLPEKAWIDSNPNGTVNTLPNGIPAASRTDKHLITQKRDTLNVYHYGYFYTTYNEIGESAPSQVLTVRAARPWIGWIYETPNAAGEPSGTDTNNPYLAADQLVLILPSAVDVAARDKGALGWNLYMFTWTDQDPVPTTAVKIGSKKLDATVNSRYIQHTAAQDVLQENIPVPNAGLLDNFTTPPKAAQGLVASDRLILVNDRTNPAVIRWTSREQGSYTNFSTNKGGGYKTLTSGNLYLTACVKLWQNPSSADTLTILCDGVDGHSTGYYMAPATVSSQSEQVQIMGFEETSASPGTTSPYGCEVVNNALYHPLDELLMKSTASNYNLNHKSMTDDISSAWSRLRNKHRIVSCVLDNRLYYLVDNPAGEAVKPGNFGNEVWVLDTAAKTPSWNRWLVGGRSLRKIEVNGRIYMSIVTERGLFYFDPDYGYDDVFAGPIPGTPGTPITRQQIPWQFETNLQGANRAHDAWARLQQVNPLLTEFQGVVEYGIRGKDLNGKQVVLEKIYRQDSPVDPDGLPLNIEDKFLIRRDFKEWYFFARSVPGEYSRGGFSSVQYRYVPSTVNSEYEDGSIETFEYGESIEAP